MKKKKIIAEGNTIIGKFMGKNFEDPLNYMYDLEWNWLMPVMNKIKNTKHKTHGHTLKPQVIVFVSTCACNILISTGGIGGGFEPYCETHKGKTQIEAVWKSAVAFIKWYNERRKKPTT